MGNSDDKPTLKITLEDLEKVTVAPEPAVAGPAGAPSGARQYGNITGEGAGPATEGKTKTNIFLQGWFYLGVAGLLGAVIPWALCEPWIIEDRIGWAHFLLIPLIVMFLCLGFGVAESIVERSLRKALLRAALIVPLGLVFGFVFERIANVIYNIGLGIAFELGVRSPTNPVTWIARGIGWMVFGVAAGIVYGLVDRSAKKGRYGALGAVIGAGIGGIIFNPIYAVSRPSVSRGIGFALFGLATGVAMGVVESALKDRWLYVAGGPLAGKQFILYKPVTTIGGNQQSDIYLFKDNSILPQHGMIQMRGSQTILQAIGPVFVSGQPIRTRVLQSGDLIQIGRYAFHFREKHRN
jgi:hypothetical protein